MKININNFNLKQIAESGQCFRWKEIKNNSFDYSYVIPAFGKCLIVSQIGNEITFSCDEIEWKNIWQDYFDYNRDYESLGNTILNSSDKHLIDSYLNGTGIRILKQDLWEVIFSFMISQNNNIKRISNSIELICQKCGKLIDNTNNVYSFPSVNEIPIEIFNDSSLGLGYRADYLRNLCIFVKENDDFISSLYKMNYDEAYKALISIKGIGKKVAECICLFGLGFVNAFPIDTHVKALLEKYYKDGIDLSLYPNEAGIVQQYLFYYELKFKNKK